MKKSTLLILSTLPGIWSCVFNVAHAACEFANGAQTGNVTFTLPALTQALNPSDTSPQKLSTVTLASADLASAMSIASDVAVWAGCTGNLVWTPLLTGVDGTSPDSTGYMSTGIDNLYLYMYAGSNTTGNFGPFFTPGVGGGAWSRSLSSIHSGVPPWSVMGDIVLVLYQNGRVRQGGIIPAGPIAALSVSDGLQIMNMNMSAITVNVLACTLTTPVVDVKMPTKFKSVFTGTGTTSETENFSIGASCDSGIMPTITFSGQTSTMGTDVFAINTGDGQATGLGIQLLHEGNIINQNEAIEVGTTDSDGEVQFPFGARYVQTENTVTAGNVNSTITFTLNYK